MNKFEQVSRDGHPMSLVSQVWGMTNEPIQWSLMHQGSRVIVSWDPPCEQNDRQTRLETLPFWNFVCGRQQFMQIKQSVTKFCPWCVLINMKTSGQICEDTIMSYFLYKLLWALEGVRGVRSMSTYRISTTCLLSGGQGTLQNNRVFHNKLSMNSLNLITKTAIKRIRSGVLFSSRPVC